MVRHVGGARWTTALSHALAGRYSVWLRRAWFVASRSAGFGGSLLLILAAGAGCNHMAAAPWASWIPPRVGRRSRRLGWLEGIRRRAGRDFDVEVPTAARKHPLDQVSLAYRGRTAGWRRHDLQLRPRGGRGVGETGPAVDPGEGAGPGMYEPTAEDLGRRSPWAGGGRGMRNGTPAHSRLFGRVQRPAQFRAGRPPHWTTRRPSPRP